LFAATTRARSRLAALSALSILLAGLAAAPRAGADEAQVPPVEKMLPRRDGLPREVLVGTVVSGYDAIFTLPLEKRFDLMDGYLDAMDAQARTKYPGHRLDLVVLVEWFMSRPGDTLERQAVRLDEVSARAASCAKKHGCYLVVPAVLREEGATARYSNVAFIFDRSGRLVGTYHKVHPTSNMKFADLEGGITPGRDFPVFDCDFGRIGIQICNDVFYPDGWQALAAEGAEIVAFPSETPQTVRPSSYALQHRYYVVSAAPRDHSAVYNPLGMIDAQATEEGVLVHEIDLSYAITGWEDGLDGGESLKRKFGDRVGFTYYHGEDAGIFWSNDPATSIGQMFKAFGYPEPADSVERQRLLQDKIRGGPPASPAPYPGTDGDLLDHRIRAEWAASRRAWLE
jgi:predicted amidohydrolase